MFTVNDCQFWRSADIEILYVVVVLVIVVVVIVPWFNAAMIHGKSHGLIESDIRKWHACVRGSGLG